MKSFIRVLFVILTLSIFLSGCRMSRQNEVPTFEPSEDVSTSTLQETVPESLFWDDVVELENELGDITTAYKLADGRYLDRVDNYFQYDGVDSWICNDGSIWHRKEETAQATTNVYAEFVVERMLAQRPDHILISDAAPNSYASRILLTFDTCITNFRYLQLQGQVDANGNLICTQISTLYEKEEVTENDLLVVETELEGLLPTRGISFTDISGNTQYYYLALSGEDNVPLLIPFN